MSLLDALRAGVGVLNKVTKGGKLTCQVGLYHWVSQDKDGVPTFIPPLGTPATPMDVILDDVTQSVNSPEGDQTIKHTDLIFLDVQQILNATQNQGIGTNDLIFMVDGSLQPVRTISGFKDSITGIPVATEVRVG